MQNMKSCSKSSKMHSINGNAYQTTANYYSPFQLENPFLSFSITPGIVPYFIFGAQGDSDSS